MGYYDGTDLNYYYFMASNFATSDRWFAPALDRTQINRMYLFAATSQGYAFPPGTNAADNAPLTAPTIFDALQTSRRQLEGLLHRRHLLHCSSGCSWTERWHHS